MPAGYGRSFLGEATTRLARLLNIDGQIPVELGKALVPVVLLQDGTNPGVGGASNRRWAAHVEWVPAGATSVNFGFKVAQDVVITSIQGWLTVAAPVSIAYLGPDAADPFAMATTFSRYIFLDRNPNNERAPVTSGLAVDIAETNGLFLRQQAQSTTTGPNLVQPFFMMSGSKLLFRTGIASGGNYNIQGYTL